jgi:NodT family efflux transporter outer membrane factor (OMF) lipoprotein
MLNHKTQGLPGTRVAIALALAAVVSGCTTLGPDYKRPEVAVQQEWINLSEAAYKPEEPIEDGLWWKVFEDPVLDEFIETAYSQNLTLKVAGLRILEARAQLGIAVGNLYPQQQQATAGATYIKSSKNGANTAGPDLNFWNYDTGLSAGWEIDFWGRFARGIESADASLLASVANYDDVLVTMTAQVANTYLAARTFQQRIAIAKENIKIQERGLKISTVRFNSGATTELDVNQAETLLRTTQASIPSFVAGQRQATNALGTLLGITPQEIRMRINSAHVVEGIIPDAPVEVGVGIPADLLRRRPDVRRAELAAWAQSALIGVAKADLYPSISLVGTIGLSAAGATSSGSNGAGDWDDMFESDSLRFQGGPALNWNIFNYGRIKNNVRVQDARLQQALVSYQNTVLQAGQEVEDSMVSFLQTKAQGEYLLLAVNAAKRSVDISMVQYEDGGTDYTTVLDTHRQLVIQEDNYTANRGQIVQSLVGLYRALGGGWKIREGKDFLQEDTYKEMRERTDWGGLLDPEAVQNIPAPNEVKRVPTPDW